MFKIAVVEDENDYADLLKEYLERFAEEKGQEFSVIRFRNAVSFLENYPGDYDLVFMDIRMPYLNGMDAAHKLREIDPSVILIFITSLAQYAIKGYEVDALDYILKPVNYYDFSMKMSRAMMRIKPRERETEILLSTAEGKVRLGISEIRYIETQGHHLIYHAGEKNYRQYATLASAEEKLKGFSFVRCNSCYLVNLKYVQKIKGFTAVVDGAELQISQPRKKEFVRRFTDYLERSSKP